MYLLLIFYRAHLLESLKVADTLTSNSLKTVSLTLLARVFMDKDPGSSRKMLGTADKLAKACGFVGVLGAVEEMSRVLDSRNGAATGAGPMEAA